MGSLDSAGDLLRLIGPGLFTKPRGGGLGPFITLHSVEGGTKEVRNHHFFSQTECVSCMCSCLVV